MKFSDDVRAEAALAKPKEKEGWNQKEEKKNYTIWQGGIRSLKLFL